MNLYKASVDLDIEVMIASDKPPTEDDILEFVRTELRENWDTSGPGWANTPQQVTDQSEIPRHWEKAIPYGDDHDGNKTCMQVLDDYVPEPEPLGEQLSMAAAQDDQQ